MFRYSFNQISGYANIESSVFAASHDVYIVIMHYFEVFLDPRIRKDDKFFRRYDNSNVFCV